MPVGMKFSPSYKPARTQSSHDEAFVAAPAPASPPPPGSPNFAAATSPPSSPGKVRDWHVEGSGGGTAAYPNPGSVAACNACGSVVQRFYHCMECPEASLFDLCVACCASIYLAPSKGNTQALEQIKAKPHPTHSISSHSMVHVAPPGT